jgi:hypothetical protein
MSPTANMQGRRGGGPPGLLDSLPVAVSLVCVGLFSFLSGGYIFARSAPIAIVFLLLAAVWVWFLRRSARPPALFLAALAALALLVGWIGLSVLWSFGPDLSWMAFDLAGLYLAVLAVVGCTPVRRLQLRLAGWGFLVVATAVGVYAFLGKGLPDVVRHAYTYARLDSPIGYWNVLALVMVMGIVVALSLAGDGRLRPGARAAAAAAAVPMGFAFFFTFSRGGWVALAVALVLYFGFTTTRLASLASLVAVAAPLAAVIWHVRGLDTLFSATTDAALRTAQGHVVLRWAVAALVLTAAGQAGLALLQGAVGWPRWSRLVAGAAVLVLLVGVSAGASWRFLEPRGGVTWVRERVRIALQDADTRPTANQAGRLISLNTGRPPLWREAFEQSRHVRVAGTGAGTFAFTHYRFREDGGVVKHAHSQWFNVLSELGVIGLVLFVTAIVLALTACIGNPFAGRRDPLHPLLVALQAGVVAFVVHLSWDWDWDMAAVGMPVFLFMGVTASYLATRHGDARWRREESRHGGGESPAAEAEPGESSAAAGSAGGPSRAGLGEAAAGEGRGVGAWPLRAAASIALVLLAVSWALPYLAARAEAEAVAASGEGRPAEALAHARRAARLDPLAVTPLISEALSLQQLGRNREALATLRRAQALQPDNYRVYYHEGLLQLRAFGRRGAALAAFRRALALNPMDRDTRREVEALLGG